MVQRKNNGWDLVETGESGKRFIFIGTAAADVSDLPVVDVGTGSVAIQQSGKKYVFHEDDGWAELKGSAAEADYGPYLEGTLAEITDDNITAIRKYALAGMTVDGDAVYSFENLTKFGDYCLANCTFGSLTLNVPKVSTTGSCVFDNTQATTPKPVSFPAATNIGYGVFRSSSVFSQVEIGSSCTYINAYAFSGATCDVILNSTRVPTLANINAFNNHTGNIYVLDALVDQYKEASNWSTYASKIKPISEVV